MSDFGNPGQSLQHKQNLSKSVHISSTVRHLWNHQQTRHLAQGLTHAHDIQAFR